MKKLWKAFAKIDSNRIVAFSAVFISLLALMVSVQEMRIMRRQQEMTMFPYLTLGRTYNAEGFGVVVKNSGIGLARINSVTLTDGDRYFNDWSEVIEAHLPDSLVFGYDMYRTSQLNEEIVTPNEEVTLFFVEWTPVTRAYEAATRDLTMEICYSSLLGDSWMVRNDEFIELDGPCPRDESIQFD
ncbi:hypothetical protein [Lewinella sp. W8]|uniref:hypothetical protein n=1 Tax=Lewinella sp. W8 TaxID=2528208 RepID=UPI001068C555|nr:hypothetical protein [Lewinella sp. W8]MTB53621.1 hypothetical protein [Lewinella sp. W8]